MDGEDTGWNDYYFNRDWFPDTGYGAVGRSDKQKIVIEANFSFFSQVFSYLPGNHWKADQRKKPVDKHGITNPDKSRLFRG